MDSEDIGSAANVKLLQLLVTMELSMNLTIEPNAIIAESEDRMSSKLWIRTQKLINETFKYISLLAKATGLKNAIYYGPYHFYISLEEDEGLFVFFGLRKPIDPQRIYANDIREHSSINVEYYLNNLSKDRFILNPELIQFLPWEFENIKKRAGYAKIKAAEFISKTIAQNENIIIQNQSFSLLSTDIQVEEKFVFVLMPFQEEWSDRIWKKHLKPIIEGSGFIAKRADDLFGQNVLTDIWESIKKADIILADVTSRNANVFYELGIAHSLNKPTIIITQFSKDIPFDILTFRHIQYQDNSDGYDKLENNIPKALYAIVNLDKRKP